METIGRSSLQVRLRLGAAILAAGAAVLPAIALPAIATAAPAKAPALGVVDPGPLVAVTEVDPTTGHNKVYPVKPGEIGHTVIGVANTDGAPVDGAGVWIRVTDDLDIAKKYDNCWYSATGSNARQALCVFDQELAPATSHALAEDFVAAKQDAQGNLPAVVFQWFTKEWIDAHGGAEELAATEAWGGEKPARGTGGLLKFEPRQLPVLGQPSHVNFAYLKLDVPAATPSATATPGGGTPTATATATPTATATAAPGTGGGLPITGSDIGTVAAAGGALVMLGGAGFLIARRRRTRFVA